MAPRTPRRVMIVEDSAVVRALLTHLVEEDPRLTVAASMASAEEAIAALDEVRPDVISMDVQLPGIDGLEATRRIMADRPTPIVVISASIDTATLGSTMEALSAGALSVVEKPVGLSHHSYAGVAREICTQLAIMADVAVVRRRLREPRRAAPAHASRAAITIAAARPKLIAIAASTGGPQALARMLNALPATLPVPMLLVQHMGAAFMAGFASWLDGVVPQRVVIAKDGRVPEAGVIHVAPGDRHLRLDGGGRMRLGDDAPVGSQRPAATILFSSIAEALGREAAAVVLTGMGDDGAAGVRMLRGTGASVLAEDASSAIVNGMPAAAVQAGALPLPLDMIAPQLLRLLQRPA